MTTLDRYKARKAKNLKARKDVMQTLAKSITQEPEAIAQVATPKVKKGIARRLDSMNAGLVDNVQKPRTEWATYSEKLQSDIVTEWLVNGGAIGKWRFTPNELAFELGLTRDELQERIKECEKTCFLALKNRNDVQQNILKHVSLLSQQIQYNRAIAVQSHGLLDEELNLIMTTREEIESMPEHTVADRNRKEVQRSKLLGKIKSLTLHKIRALEVLMQTTDQLNEFVSLFSGKRMKDEPNPLVPTNEEPGDKAGNTFVTHTDAIRLLEEKQGVILPSQGTVYDSGTRNPNAGFEEFIDHEAVDDEGKA